MRRVWWLMGLMLFLIGQSSWADQPYLTLKVDHGDGSFAVAQGWVGHAFDASWVQEVDYLDVPQVAWDFGGTKYATLGPDVSGGWIAYVWAGNHMIDGGSYDLIVQANNPVHLVGKKFDGTIIFDQTLVSGQSFTWSLTALRATTAQWRTRGYQISATMVPEPSSILALGGAFLLTVGFYRRRR